MLPFIIVAGLTLTTVPIAEEVRDVRVADIDGDGIEDVIATTETAIYLLRHGRGPTLKRPPAPLVVVGHKLCGVVRKGRYHTITDPFGAWNEGPPQGTSLLAQLNAAKPSILLSPGDVDGDGKDDPILATRQGFETPAGLVPVMPEASLTISTNEAFAVEYRIPVPHVGRFKRQDELVFFTRNGIEAYAGTEQTVTIPLKLPTRGPTADSIRRNHVFLRDIDGNGKLDLLVVVAKGATGLFASFEATARFWRDERMYVPERDGFYRPATFLKVEGALLRPTLLDADSDGDLDLVLATVDTSLIAAATGTAPGTYHVFRFEKRGYRRLPAWTFRGPVPMSVFTEKPEPPVRILPDLDNDGRPEALARGSRLRLLEANREGKFKLVHAAPVSKAGMIHAGQRLAAVAHKEGVTIIAGQR